MFDGRHSSNWALYLKETSKKVWGMAFLYREPYVSKVCQQPLSQKILEQHRKNISKDEESWNFVLFSFSWKRVDRISKNFVRKVNFLMKILCQTNFFLRLFVELIFSKKVPRGQDKIREFSICWLYKMHFICRKDRSEIGDFQNHIMVKQHFQKQLEPATLHFQEVSKWQKAASSL